MSNNQTNPEDDRATLIDPPDRIAQRFDTIPAPEPTFDDNVDPNGEPVALFT